MVEEDGEGLRPCKYKVLLWYCWQFLARVSGEDLKSESIYLFSLYLQLSFIIIPNKACYSFLPWVEEEHILKSQSFAGQENSSLPSSKEKNTSPTEPAQPHSENMILPRAY